MNSHSLVEQVQKFIKKHELLSSTKSIVVGLSGGPDSVALLSILHSLQPEYGYTLIAATLDHQWRPESADEVTFCEQLAKRLSIPFRAKKAEEIRLPKSAGLTKEELGRALRRKFFEAIAQEYDAQAIALGHHYNDQQETFFLRMIRGATVAGLSGMKPKNSRYIRPLLACTKEELLSYLKDQSLSYCVDGSNEDTTFLRNAIRHKIIPAFQACDNRFEESFKKTLVTVQETDRYLDRVARAELATMTTQEDGHLILNIERFLATDSFLHERLLIVWLIHAQVPFVPSTSFFSELLRFIQGNGVQHQLHPAWKILRKQTMLMISKNI